MPETAIWTDDLGKQYRIGQREPYKTLRDSLVRATTAPLRADRARASGTSEGHQNQNPEKYIWALRHLSFQVREGEVVGIIGPNGAGKTTLLKLLSRITEPSEGVAKIRGRVGALLEVGTGFHQELTGRENVYLNGAILGMRKREIDAKFDQIVDFAGIERFMDTPVKRYSDGMRVRLGFAVSAHLEPDILIVDEVLAVGDAAFQRKCMTQMGDLANGGRAVLLVSHNMAAIQSLCTRAYGLDRGRIFAEGNVTDVIGQYLERHDRPELVPLRERVDRKGNGKLRFTNLSISGASKSSDTVQCGSRTAFELEYEGTSPLRDVEVYLFFEDQLGLIVFFAATYIAGRSFLEVPSRGTFVCRFDRFPLLPGTYHVVVEADVSGHTADKVKNAVTIHVVEGDYYGSGYLPDKGWGQVAADHDWEFVADSRTPSPDEIRTAK